MRLNSKLILMISAVSAILTFSMIVNMLQKANVAPSSDLVVTAMKDLDVGAKITKEDIDVLVAPSGTDFKVSFGDIAKVIGKSVRNPIRRGKVINTFDLVQEGDDLTGLIPKGYRASTILIEIPKEAISFLKFGNRVDVLFSEKDKVGGSPRYIMRNILVLNVTTNEAAGSSNQAYVTLAVKPDGIEILSYATRNGKVDLTIRPMSDSDSKDKEEYMSYDELLGVKAAGFIPSLTNQTEIELIRGVKKETVKI